jgi:hypothetical protein
LVGGFRRTFHASGADVNAENGKAPSKAFQDMMAFSAEHRAGTWLLKAATDDYAASRCLLLNLMFPGLPLGAQAVEKYLKGYLLLADPKRDVRALGHTLLSLIKEVDAIAPRLDMIRFARLAEKFTRHYRSRYPDNPEALTAKTTADRAELDDFVIFINENLPCPITHRYRSGLYAAVTGSLGFAARVTPNEHWIKLDNRALAPLLPQIVENYALVQNLLYPKT